MKIFLLASLLLLLWAISCNKDKDIDKGTTGLTIVGGLRCGSCGYSDSVIITECQVNYRNMRYCDHHAYSKVSHIRKSEWDKLTASIDYEEFDNLQLNTCNVCLDGCDKWITIRNGSYSHKIRFGYQDSVALQPVIYLVQKLDSIRQIYLEAAEM